MIGKRFRWDREQKKLIEMSTDIDISEAVAPAFHRDEFLDGIESPLSETGEKFYSRSAYVKHLKDRGFEISGGSHLGQKPKPREERMREHREDIRNDILEAKRALTWGEVPLSEKEKEECRREQREIENYKKRQKVRWA